MSNALLHVLEEQNSMGFTGRINVLRSANSQTHAVILMREGRLVNCRMSERSGEKALLDLVFQDVSNSMEFKLVVEPEVVSEAEGIFNWNIDQLKSRARQVYENYLSNKKLKPPPHLKLLLNADFVLSGEAVEPAEFDVLSAISDYSRVQDIYDHCALMEYEVTRALISLRKKGAIKVVSS